MIAQFALRLLCGMSLAWCLVRRGQVTSGYFRIQMLVALGLAVLAVLSAEAPPTPADVPGAESARRVAQAAPWIAAALGATAFLGSVLWTLERRRGGTICVFLVALGSSTLVAAQAVARALADGGGHAVWLAPLSDLATAAVLGTAVSGMLLGHWYLTAPTMSIEPLARLDLWFAAAAGLRLLLSALGWFLAGERLAGGTEWTWFALRWTGGIVGPLIVAEMVRRILRYRNTQSATGVLFVGVILVFIGETSGALLSRVVRFPL